MIDWLLTVLCLTQESFEHMYAHATIVSEGLQRGIFIVLHLTWGPPTLRLSQIWDFSPKYIYFQTQPCFSVFSKISAKMEHVSLSLRFWDVDGPEANCDTASRFPVSSKDRSI
jgi:hypothetical protein